MTYPTFQTELRCLRNYELVAGVDEVGRGPLAGPVVAAAVILDAENIGVRRSPNKWWSNLADSKQLTANSRFNLAQQIKSKCLAFGLGVVAPDDIDKINIHYASLLAMKNAIADCKLAPDYILIDGLFTIKDLPQRQKAIVNGDQLVLSIAAASIVAKVHRDELMNKMHKLYPRYGFDKHKGYATALHRAIIDRYGPCPIHRRSFLN